jgi:hypothetical protein
MSHLDVFCVVGLTKNFFPAPLSFSTKERKKHDLRVYICMHVSMYLMCFLCEDGEILHMYNTERKNRNDTDDVYISKKRKKTNIGKKNRRKQEICLPP